MNKPVCVIDQEGNKHWYLDGKHHREDGPAIEWTDGGKFWMFHNKIHREDGPAVEYANGTIEYWLNDERYFNRDYYKELVKRGLMSKEDAIIELL